MDFFKLASIYHCDKLKSFLDFGTLTYMKFSLKRGISCAIDLIPDKLAYTYLFLNSMYFCDLDPIVKFIVLYDGYPLNEQMELLQVYIDISKRLIKADRL